MTKTLHCPHCQAEITWTEEYPYRPFCSKRCQLIDLGEWASEEKKLPATDAADDYELQTYQDHFPSDQGNT